MKPGGRFIGVIAGPKQNGDMPWSRVGLPLYKALQSRISTDKLASCVLPVCWRTQEDVLEGFIDGQWEVEVCEFHETKDPVREEYERGEMSATEFGKATIESFRAVCHQTCLSALEKTLSSTEEAEKVLAEAYDDCVDVISSDPETYNLDVSFWYVLAKKL